MRRKQVEGTIYLLHFSEKFHHDCHYLGWTEGDDVTTRLETHRSGCGARIIRAAMQVGITFTLVRTWKGTRTLERRLKNTKQIPAYCPVCRELKRTHKG